MKTDFSDIEKKVWNIKSERDYYLLDRVDRQLLITLNIDTVSTRGLLNALIQQIYDKTQLMSRGRWS